MFKVNNKDTRICKVNDNINNKDTRICKVNDNINNKVTITVVLISLLLTLNIFHFNEHIPLVSSIVRPVYPSGFIFQRKGVGWDVYTYGAHTRGVNCTTYLGGIYLGGLCTGSKLTGLYSVSIVRLYSGLKLHEFRQNSDYL